MATQWKNLIDRFRDRLEALERNAFDGNGVWQIYCLQRALELMEEEEAQAASKWLDDFDKTASLRQRLDAAGKSGKSLTVGDIRRRFDNLDGGIV